jgi:hypothetical protein
MYRSESSHDQVERDPRNDPRTRSQADGEVEIERKPIVADRSREEETPWPSVQADRRRTERRRIERMGTDI